MVKDHLKGTHVYEIKIDHTLEPPSAKTWAGITCYSEFIYHYENQVCVKVEVKQQTNVSKSKTLRKEKLFKLWPSYLHSESTSTGVTSTFDMEESQRKLPRFQHKPKETCVRPKKETMITSLQEEALNTDRKCPSCSKFFLRKCYTVIYVKYGKCYTVQTSSR